LGKEKLAIKELCEKSSTWNKCVNIELCERSNMCSKCINIRVSNHHLKYIDCYPIHMHELGFMELDLKFNIKRAYSKPLKMKCHYKGYSSPLYSFVPYFSTIAYFYSFFLPLLLDSQRYPPDFVVFTLLGSVMLMPSSTNFQTLSISS